MDKYVLLKDVESMLENAQTITDGVYVGYCRDDIRTYLLPVADVVQVVRCKDCAIPHNQWTGCPKLNGLVTPPDFYCSYGERRKEDAKIF